MKLYDLQSGKPLGIGDGVVDVVTGTPGKITSIHPPTTEASPGIVGVTLRGMAYDIPCTPTEIGARFADDDAITTEGQLLNS